MRKWLPLPVLLALFFAVVYGLIPAKISIDERTAVPVNAKAFVRSLSDEKNWLLWWPGSKPAGTGFPARFTYKNKTYTLLEKRFSSYVVSVSDGQDSLLTELVLLPLQNGTAEAAWLSAIAAGSAPFTRIKSWWWAKSLASDLRALLHDLKSFYGSEERLYGFPIREGLVSDSLLVFTRKTTEAPLSTDGIYNMVDRLQAFIRKNGAVQTGDPMLNVVAAGDSVYTTRVALPVSKRLPDEGDVQFKWMLGNGNILVTEVKGGPAQIKAAFEQMQNYIQDHMRTAPAIEFQSLVTDRRAEPDTSKWMTKLYWPVM